MNKNNEKIIINFTPTGMIPTKEMISYVPISISGGVRVGLEDNIWFDNKRTRLATNIDLPKRVHLITEANEKKYSNQYCFVSTWG